MKKLALAAAGILAVSVAFADDQATSNIGTTDQNLQPAATTSQEPATATAPSNETTTTTTTKHGKKHHHKKAHRSNEAAPATESNATGATTPSTEAPANADPNAPATTGTTINQ
jgi:hypothetical protein